MPHPGNPVVLVLGMHRSGTSMLTAGLPALGIDLGENLMPARAGDNDKGYFENPDVVALNEVLLDMDGGHWASLAFGTPIDYAAERYAARRAEAVRIIREQFPPGPIAIKDPRLCLTLPFWRGVIADARPGAPVLHLHLFRHPSAIAASFAARAQRPEVAALVEPIGGDHEQSLLLWLSYTYQALRNSRGADNWCTQHAALLGDPSATLTRLAGAAGLALDAKRLTHFCSDFVDPRLTHHRDETAVAGAYPELGFIDALWAELAHLHGRLDRARHDALLAAFPDLEFAFLWSVQARLWFADRRRKTQLQAELAAKQQAVDVREDKLIALYRTRDQLSEALRYAQQQVRAQQRQLEEQQRVLDWLRPDRQLRKLYRRMRSR